MIGIFLTYVGFAIKPRSLAEAGVNIARGIRGFRSADCAERICNKISFIITAEAKHLNGLKTIL